MKVTRLGPPIPILSSGLGGNAGSRIPAGGNDLQVLTSNGSNGRYWGENVRRITSNGSNILVSPDVNFVSGSNIFFAVASNTLTIHGQAGGGGGVTALTANGSNSLAGSINLQAGVGIALGVSGSTITITNTGSSGGGSGGLTQAYVGKNAVGASWETATSGRIYTKKITLANACLMTDIQFYTQMTADVARYIQVFLYGDNGSGSAPLDLLAAFIPDSTKGTLVWVLEQSPTGPRNPRWLSFAIGRWLTAGDYWIGARPDCQTGTGIQIAYDTSGSDLHMTNTGGQAGDWGLWTTGSTSRDYSIRANTIR